jgi:hypothetical protein
MNKYAIAYRHYTWVVVEVETNKGIVCFPTQVGAANWIKKQVRISCPDYKNKSYESISSL